jgi:hypothetical protein
MHQAKDLRRKRLHESIDCILRLAGLFTPRGFTLVNADYFVSSRAHNSNPVRISFT